MNKKPFYDLSDNDKREILEEVRNKIHLPLASIEKDWWVVQTLQLIFKMEVGRYLVFKGGTSLSKGWKLIERFSEDIDLGLSREFLGFPRDISRNQIRTKLRKASNQYLTTKFKEELQKSFDAEGIKVVEVKKLENGASDQDPIKLEVKYPSVSKVESYIQPKVILEIGSRSMQEPYTFRKINSFIGETLRIASLLDFPSSVPCVNPERTLFEKLFLLHEEFQRPVDKIRVNRLSRHLYDIHMISQSPYYDSALKNRKLFQSIVMHRQKFSRLSNVDYKSHFPPNLDPIPPQKYLDLWEKDYIKMQTDMIYGQSLPFSELISAINKIVYQINKQNI